MKAKQYTPRRASQRWLANAPAHILDIFRNKCGTWDILYTGPWLYAHPAGSQRTYANTWIGGREMSAEPCHPQGVGVLFELPAHQAAAYRRRAAHRRVAWDSLPEAVKAAAIRDGGIN